ncbi:MAG: hypothetical protein NZ951_06040 [Dehalococcoidia bacterium]|nr:hypothetical protein [Dehalococcoidia bacterium]
MSTSPQQFGDLLQLLRQHPEWREELRRWVLTEEVLALPPVVQALAEAQKRTQEHLARLAEHQERLTQRVEDLAQGLVHLTQRIDALTERVDTLAQDLVILTQRVDDLTQRLDTLTARVDTLPQRVDDLTQRLDILTARVDALAQDLIILTRRVDALTERVDTLTQRLDALTARVDTLTQRVDDLTAQVETLTRRMDQLTEQMRTLVEVQQRMASDLGQVKGWAAEARYRTYAPAYLRELVRRTHVLTTEEVMHLLEDLEAAGRLTHQQVASLAEADLLVRGRWRRDGREVYLVVEVSWGVGLEDVVQARKRADILSAAGLEAVPVVAGAWVAPDASQAARTMQVWQVTDGTVAPPGDAQG